jgi:predicted RNA-binding protein with PUA-like domain
MAYWLFKSEPDVFSFDDLTKKGAAGQEWDGVRNYQARNNMRAMQLGDRGFFYHSNIGKEIVGIVEVAKLAHPDSTDDSGRWECVDLRAIRPIPKPYSLEAAKAEPRLEGHGARRQFAPLRAAGDGRRMEADLRTGRARSRFDLSRD